MGSTNCTMRPINNNKKRKKTTKINKFFPNELYISSLEWLALILVGLA